MTPRAAASSSTESTPAFKPNDPEAPDELYDTTDLIRRLALLNNKMFPAEQGSHPVQAYTSIRTVVNPKSAIQELRSCRAVHFSRPRHATFRCRMPIIDSLVWKR
jgi:hypothetical protein